MIVLLASVTALIYSRMLFVPSPLERDINAAEEIVEIHPTQI
jgi:hypothetical protein